MASTRISNSAALKALVAHYGRRPQQRGGNSPYGQIYAGRRFGPILPQRGAGIGSFLSSMVRGISSLISRTPSWVKTGAKIVGKTALRNLGEYVSDVQSGADKATARKRALERTRDEIAAEIGKKMRGEGLRKTAVKKKCCKKASTIKGRGKAKSYRKTSGKGSVKKRRKTAAAKRKKTASTRRRSKRPQPKSIKARSKFDLLS